MEIELKKLQEIAIEYFDIEDEEKLLNNWNDFMYCYEKIKNYPCVIAKDTWSLIDALYLIASDIASDDFFKTTEDLYGNKFYNYASKHKSLDYMVDDALYRIYDEYAVPSLSDNYTCEKGLTKLHR